MSEQLISNQQNLMCGGNDGFGPTPPGLDAVKECTKITLLAVRGRPSGLCQHAPQCAIPLAAASALLLTGALVLSRDKPGPTGTMIGIGKYRDVRAQFGNQVPSHQLIDTGNGD